MIDSDSAGVALFQLDIRLLQPSNGDGWVTEDWSTPLVPG